MNSKIDKVDFTILPNTIDKDEYCNKYIELALTTDFKDSYYILESIYFLGRWYATRNSLKNFFNVGDTTLKRKLDILYKFGLIEYHLMNTPNSYVKLTNNGASLICKKKVRWDNTKNNFNTLLDKSDILYTLPKCSKSDIKLLIKKENRDELLTNIFGFRSKDTISIDTLEQNHIYISNCNSNEITFAIKYTNTEDYFKDCAKAFEFVSKYEDVNNIKINILLMTKDSDGALGTLNIIKEDDFKKTERKKLLLYLIDKAINISYDDFLIRITKSTKVISY